MLVTKVWQGTGDKTESELNAMITFSPALGRYIGLPLETVISDIHETLNTTSWLSADGKTRYTIEVGFIIANGIEANNLTIAEVGLHTIVFTNRVIETDVAAALTVTKVWQGTGDKTESELNAMIAFHPALGQYTDLAPGTVIGNIHETINTPTWLSADGSIRYTIEQVSLLVDGVAGDSLTLAENGNHTIVFTNRVTGQSTAARVEVRKEWAGGTVGLDLNALTNQIVFNPALGIHTVAAGTVINNIYETFPSNPWTVLSFDGRTRYTIERVGVLVDGVAGNSLTVAENGNHSIVFINRVTATNIAASLTVLKMWIGASDRSEAEMNAMITFNPSLGYSTNLVPGTVISNIHETINTSTWLSADGSTRYTIEQVSLLVDGAAASSLTLAENGNHTIVFTNRVTSQSTLGSMQVSKQWIGDTTGLDLTALTNQITFYPGLGTYTSLLPGIGFNDIREVFPANPWTWVSADGRTRYTVTQDGVLVDGYPATSITITEGGNHTIVFRNRVLTTPVLATVTATKHWIGDTAGLDLNQLTQQILFYPDLVEQIAPPGTVISNIHETFPSNPWTWLSPDGSARYTITQESVTVDGVNATSLTVAEGGRHMIVFTNRVTRELYGGLDVEKVWTGCYEGELPEAVYSLITFNPSLGRHSFPYGTVITDIRETLTYPPYVDVDGRRYTITKSSVLVDCEWDVTSLTITPGRRHKIIFFNNVCETPIP